MLSALISIVVVKLNLSKNMTGRRGSAKKVQDQVDGWTCTLSSRTLCKLRCWNTNNNAPDNNVEGELTPLLLLENLSFSYVKQCLFYFGIICMVIKESKIDIWENKRQGA